MPNASTAAQTSAANDVYTDLEERSNYRSEEEEDKLDDIIKYLAKTNTSDFNKLKLVEELSELMEVLVKSHTKHPDNKPKMEKIVEELGDVSVRMAIFALEYGLEEAIEDRMYEKLTQLYGYIKAGKYKGGV